MILDACGIATGIGFVDIAFVTASRWLTCSPAIR